MITHKTCRCCGYEKALDDFSKDSRKKYGVSSYCKVCKRAKTSAFRKANPEHARELGRKADAKPSRIEKKKAWAEANKDKIVAAQQKHNKSDRRKQTIAKWLSANPDKRRVATLKYRKLHPEKVRLFSHNWTVSNREKNSEKSQRRRARLRGAAIQKIDKDFLIALRKKPCAFCGTVGKSTVDHIIPISRGGRHSADNLQPLCLSCNSKKHAKTMDEFIQHVGAIR